MENINNGCKKKQSGLQIKQKLKKGVIHDAVKNSIFSFNDGGNFVGVNGTGGSYNGGYGFGVPVSAMCAGRKNDDTRIFI